MILGWTLLTLVVIVRVAVGRIGLRRSATRAPGGRLYASRRGFLSGRRVCFFPIGIGPRCVKLRGVWGAEPPSAFGRDDFFVPQVMSAKADRHRAVQSQFHDHLAATLTR